MFSWFYVFVAFFIKPISRRLNHQSTRSNLGLDALISNASLLYKFQQALKLHTYTVFAKSYVFLTSTFSVHFATGTDEGDDKTGRGISERLLFSSMERAHRKGNRTSKDQRKPLKFLIDENVVLKIASFKQHGRCRYGCLIFPGFGHAIK